MAAMRVAIAAPATALLLVASACGSGTAPTSANLGRDAAGLVPPDAIAFVNVDGNLDSQQWQRLDDLTRGLPLRTRVVDRVQKALRTAQLDFDEDVRPAIGDELDVAILGGEERKPEAIVLTKPKDEAKLRSLVAAYDEHAEGYRVERIGDWSVVADSPATFQKVREAESGRSLADVQWFHEASDRLTGDALARAYARGAALRSLPAEIGGLVRAAGSPQWVAARLEAERDAIRLELQAGSLSPAPALYRPTLLRDVPSGAVLAVSFKDLDRPLGRLAADPALRDSLREIERYLGVRLARLAPALRGEGAFYVLPGALLPVFALEVQSPDPQAAVGSLRVLAAQLRAKTGNVLPLRVARYGSRVVLTDAPTTLGSRGGSLVDDQSFKDALAAAGAPEEVTFLAYADVQRLKPMLETLIQLAGKGATSPKSSRLDKIGTVMAFGTQSRAVIRVRLK